MTTTPVNHGAGLPARASKVTGRGQGGEGMRLKVPPACRANPAHFILAVAGVPAMREERLGRPQRAGRRARDARAASVGRPPRRLSTTGRTARGPRAARPKPGRAGRQCPPGGGVQAARPRLLDTGCCSLAEGQRREGAGSDVQTGPVRPLPRPSPRALHPTSPAAADSPPPPGCRRSPSPCRCWWCARRPASGCSWCGGWGEGGEGKGTRRASAAPGPGEEVEGAR